MNRGFAGLGYTIVLFVAIVSASLYFSMRINNSHLVRRRAFYKGALDSLVLSLESSFKSQSAWNKTVKSSLNNNGIANLEKCMNQPDYDCPAGEYPLSVVDDSGTLLIDSSAATNGFNLDFKPCVNYGESAAGCFLRYELTWRPECPASGPCYNPPIKVRSQLAVAPEVLGSVNLSVSNYVREFSLR